MALYQWSTTPANNATAGSINWAEGQAPSTVNDSARQMMADVATWYQSPEWVNYGLTPTYVSATQYTLVGNQTGIHSIGRRAQAIVTAGTIYGTIINSVFTSLTTVTVVWDSGSLDAGLSQVLVGILNPATSSFPTNYSPAVSALHVTGTAMFLGTGQAGEIDLQLNNSNTEGNLLLTNSGVLGFYDITRSILRWSSDTAGNFAIAGTLTQSSDARLKTDVQQISNALARVKKLRGVTYRWKDANRGVKQTGLIAQNVQSVMPEAVKEGPDGHLSVAYGNLVGLLVEAINELSAEVDALKSK